MQSAAFLVSDSVQVRQHPKPDVSNLKHSAYASVVHSSAPSSRPNTYAERDEMPSEPITKTCFTSSDPRNHARTRLQESLTLHITEPAKVVARKVAAPPKTVESHRQAIPKSWGQLIAYCRAYPAFALDVVEAMGLDIDRDRAAYSAFLSLQRQIRGE